MALTITGTPGNDALRGTDDPDTRFAAGAVLHTDPPEGLLDGDD